MRSPLEDYSICVTCGKRYTDGYHKQCDECLERTGNNRKAFRQKHPDYNKIRYHSHKAAGLCVKCNAPALPGKVTCAKHLVKQRMTNKRSRDRKPKTYRADNECVWCGAERLEGKKLCPDCYGVVMANLQKAKAVGAEKRKQHRGGNNGIFQRKGSVV